MQTQPDLGSFEDDDDFDFMAADRQDELTNQLRKLEEQKSIVN